MKRFGSFLVDTGIVSSGQLAEALLAQIKSTPPSVVVLFDLGYLNAENVLDILSLQSDNHVDFPTACKQLALWESKFVDVLRGEAAKNRPKLGKFLLDKGWVQPKQLLSELQNFQHYCEDHQVSAQLKTPLFLDVNVSVCVNDSDDSQSDSAFPEVEYNKFIPCFDNLEQEFVSDYLDIFCEEKFSSMESSVLSLDALADGESHDGYRILDALFGEYHSLKGSARSVGAALTETLIHESEDLLSFFKKFSGKIQTADYGNLSAINLKILDMLWLLRTDLLDISSEEEFWKEKTSRKNYLTLLRDIQLMLQKLEGLGYEISLDDICDEF